MGGPGGEAGLLHGGQGTDFGLAEEADSAEGRGQREERELFYQHRAVLAREPGRGVRRQPPQRVDVKQQQGRRQGYGYALGKQRQEKGGQGQEMPPPERGSFSFLRARPQVPEHRQQVEKTGQQVVPARQPGRGFHPQGMQREKKGGRPRREIEVSVPGGGEGPRRRQQPGEDKADEQGVARVQKHAGQVIAEGVHSPGHVIEAESNAGQRGIRSHAESSEHPLQVFPAEPAVVPVL